MLPYCRALINIYIFQNQAPSWWKTPLMGPSFPTGHKPAPKEMRKPGCNGGVCYCNKENYCNDRHHYLTDSEECPEELEHHKWDVRCRKRNKSELWLSTNYNYASYSSAIHISSILACSIMIRIINWNILILLILNTI